MVAGAFTYNKYILLYYTYIILILYIKHHLI